MEKQAKTLLALVSEISKVDKTLANESELKRMRQATIIALRNLELIRLQLNELLYEDASM